MYSQQAVENILKQIAKKKITPKRAFQKLRHLSYESLKFARIDHHRPIRKNLPEVIYAPGKTDQQLRRITSAMKGKGPLLITRLERGRYRRLKRYFPKLSYSEEGCIAYAAGKTSTEGLVAIVTAGTSDIPIAEEAKITLKLLGRGVACFYDVGVSGLHRLLDHLREIEKANVVICIAGMEGALPSVLAGLIAKPVVAVPTSSGYGASFGGLAPLLTMMSSCAQGVAVVNIDSGFSAACFAHLVLGSSSINADDIGEKRR
ncbi:MAG: nickel pincer cofactor biosynthesis protein LarB [Candidatus Omnitrophica bacterium]|nr:nickel pincer cofactor biosynthesis protein LarB [Candidatus Omnitrophota bacterium]